jgi:3'(2'), 5'-bisphosphate nucleotidase
MNANADLSCLAPDLPDDQRDDWALGLGALAVAAGQVILEIEKTSPASTSKADGSPVTLADQASEALIIGELAKQVPWLTVIAEEQAAAGLNGAAGRIFALVDPLDGTKEFISRNGEYTVNIALIRDHQPVVGVIYAPATGKLWLGGRTALQGTMRDGVFAQTDLQPIHCRTAPAGLTVVSSRSHPSPEVESFLQNHTIAGRSVAGSSLKFCTIAEGRADLYPRFSPTMEWDTAAGHAILLAAGGGLCQPDGSDFLYGLKQDSWLNGPFIAYGDGRLRPSR